VPVSGVEVIHEHQHNLTFFLGLFVAFDDASGAERKQNRKSGSDKGF